jgi:anti-sigma B factor antagonist
MRMAPPMSDFRFHARPEHQTVNVVLAGELDMGATFRLEPELDRLLDEGDVRRLVLDVGGVEFMDSAGLSVLISANQRARDLGIDMSLANPSDAVRRVLDASGTDDLLGGPDL